MSAAPQGSLAEVLLELQSLRQQQAREYSSLWQKLCNVEEAMQAWAKNAHAAAPAAAVHLNGRAVVHAPGQADAALAQGQPSPAQMHPFSQQLAKPSKQPAPPSPWIAVEHLRPDVAEKMHLLGGSQGDAVFSDGAAREQEPTFEPRRTLWWWARQVCPLLRIAISVMCCVLEVVLQAMGREHPQELGSCGLVDGPLTRGWWRRRQSSPMFAAATVKLCCTMLVIAAGAVGPASNAA